MGKIGKRDRQVIETEVKAQNVSGGFPFLTLEVLLDIRDLLQALVDAGQPKVLTEVKTKRGW